MKTASNSTQEQVRELLDRIKAVRLKRKAVRTATGIAFAFAVLVGVFAIEMTLDFLVELPWVARACALAVAVGGSLLWLWRDMIHPLRKRLSDDDVASMIEYALPAFRTRFIASIQLARAAGESADLLVRALVEETAAMATKMNYGCVIKSTRLKRGLRFAWCVLVVACGLAWFGGEASPILFKRALLSSVSLPRKTHIESITGDRSVGVGEDLKIEVTASGVLPPGGHVIARIAGKPQRQFALEHDPADQAKYSLLIRSPQESFTYFVKLNDATSDTFTVKTTPRPAVVEVNCEQAYPSYIKQPPVPRSVGDLTLLAGSRLKVMITANSRIGKGWLHLEGLDKDVVLSINPKDQTKLTGEFEIPPKDLTGFSVRLENMDGVVSGQSATYRIDLMPDRDPTVRIIHPVRREELVTPQASMLIAFEAKDDYGVAEIVLHYSIDQGDEKTIPFDLGGKTPKNVMRRFEWKLASLQPSITLGSTVEFWVVVADANTWTGPGTGSSEHFQMRVVNEDEKRLDIQNRVKDTMGGISDIRTSQEELNKTLGEVIFEKKENP